MLSVVVFSILTFAFCSQYRFLINWICYNLYPIKRIFIFQKADENMFELISAILQHYTNSVVSSSAPEAFLFLAIYMARNISDLNILYLSWFSLSKTALTILLVSKSEMPDSHILSIYSSSNMNSFLWFISYVGICFLCVLRSSLILQCILKLSWVYVNIRIRMLFRTSSFVRNKICEKIPDFKLFDFITNSKRVRTLSSYIAWTFLKLKHYRFSLCKLYKRFWNIKKHCTQSFLR